MNGRQQAGKKFDTLEFTYGTKTPPQPLHRCTVQVRRRCATARNGRWRRSRVPGTVCQWRCRRELSCARDGRLKVGARSMSSTGRASGRGVQEEHHREDGVHWETAPLRFAGCMVQRSRTATTRVEFGDCNARCRSRASGSSPVKSVSSVCKFGADAYAGSTYCMVMTAGRTVLMHEECAGGRRIERMMHTKSDDAVEGAARRSASWGRRLRWCWDGVDKLGKAYEGGRRSRRMVEREKRAAFASNQATRAGQAGRGRPQGGQVADANYKGIGRRVIRGSDRLQIRPSEPHLHYLHALGAQIRRARLPACVRWRVRGRRIAEEARQSGGGRGGGGERARLDLEASRQPWGREKGRRAHHLRRVHATARGVVKKSWSATLLRFPQLDAQVERRWRCARVVLQRLLAAEFGRGRGRRRADRVEMGKSARGETLDVRSLLARQHRGGRVALESTGTDTLIRRCRVTWQRISQFRRAELSERSVRARDEKAKAAEGGPRAPVGGGKARFSVPTYTWLSRCVLYPGTIMEVFRVPQKSENGPRTKVPSPVMGTTGLGQIDFNWCIHPLKVRLCPATSIYAHQVEFIQGLSAPFDQVQPWLRPSRPWIFSICDAQFPSLYHYSPISSPPLLRGLNAEDGITLCLGFRVISSAVYDDEVATRAKKRETYASKLTPHKSSRCSHLQIVRILDPAFFIVTPNIFFDLCARNSWCRGLRWLQRDYALVTVASYFTSSTCPGSPSSARPTTSDDPSTSRSVCEMHLDNLPWRCLPHLRYRAELVHTLCACASPPSSTSASHPSQPTPLGIHSRLLVQQIQAEEDKSDRVLRLSCCSRKTVPRWKKGLRYCVQSLTVKRNTLIPPRIAG
ncbi:hypothetical protein DFH06DRAFT_1435553 [Mycena polygramma]|nr:hypothetical protein DFH06DRAFT_1435553 [Mycena polygramma]